MSVEFQFQGSIYRAFNEHLVVDACHSDKEHAVAPPDPALYRRRCRTYLEDVFLPYVHKRGKLKVTVEFEEELP